ncbi:related to multidrug efflux pump [Fusarium fujikuroi IMI 58289]|uniref:Related to multidrug efflux pump n=1 Tax=Gibberella fujikuroi (strain CBS 195.34 / IMI 58289 / NRRL A-6831) TaxID=1279085 RepID=S0E3A4_GIBF5|nr:related to multidrug efflux pump [Fusarium fujikuroi IMI 58289]CCT69329.1 related to multidrug efflux pump [Fusarium fujikuroi IMI 58289]
MPALLGYGDESLALDFDTIAAAPFMRMWSYVQRRQIANQVRLDHQNHIESIEYARPRFRKRSFSSRNNTGTSGEVSQQEPSESHCLVQSTCEDDPLNPLNWPRSSKAKNILVICSLVFTQCWAGSAISIGNSMASQEFGVGQIAENLSTAMFLFGVGTGALFAGPISETVGRNPTYLVATAFYLCFLLGSAMTLTFGGQVVCRYFVGLCASATLTINGASVNDQFRPVKRALVFPIVAWANVAASGWIVSNPRLGWRWTEWTTLMISGAAFVVALLFLPETYFPLILSWKAKELRRVTGDPRYTSQHEQKHSFWKQMRETLPLPATFFRSEPVIIVLGLYLVLLYILLFSFLSGFDYIFKETYKLEPGYQGSCFAAIAAGATAFVLCGPGLYEWARQHTERVRGASIQPEFRLWPAIVTAPFLPIALFWLGWTNYSTVSIWSGLGACFLFGIVLTAIYVSSYEYITDSYGEHSAIALGSITMSRYLIAGGMVMAARLMYEGIGVHWTMTVLGCVAMLLTPAPILFWKYGPQLRRRSPYATTDV